MKTAKEMRVLSLNVKNKLLEDTMEKLHVQIVDAARKGLTEITAENLNYVPGAIEELQKHGYTVTFLKGNYLRAEPGAHVVSWK